MKFNKLPTQQRTWHYNTKGCDVNDYSWCPQLQHDIETVFFFFLKNASVERNKGGADLLQTWHQAEYVFIELKNLI